MMSILPPLDAHSHIDLRIDTRELQELEAVLFAVTRSLAESQEVASRADTWTVWGVGCHPGLARAQHAFREQVFSQLLISTPFVGEIGIDGGSRVSIEEQLTTLRGVLKVISSQPRIASIHSFKATSVVLEELENTPIVAPVLHWWLGTEEETKRAVEIGCYFSINPSSVSRRDVLSGIPLERVLTETDHPFGDRCVKGAVPGNVRFVERELARYFGLPASQVRKQVWNNLLRLTQVTDTKHLYPQDVRALFESPILLRGCETDI